MRNSGVRGMYVGPDRLAALDDAGKIRAAGAQAVEHGGADGGAAIAARTGLLAAFEALGAQFGIAAAGARPIAEGLGSGWRDGGQGEKTGEKQAGHDMGSNGTMRPCRPRPLNRS
jgi:hypothetical protein